jgi:dynein-related subfamily AAA family protein
MPTRFPTVVGLEAAIAVLSELEMHRVASHLPVLLAVDSAVEAGNGIVDVECDGDDLPTVPNPDLYALLDRWFGVPGDENWPYFSPMPLPGGQSSLHWRTKGIIAQNTMTRAIAAGYVAPAASLRGRIRGYPLRDLDSWREAVIEGIDERGVDLAALGVWLARTDGLESASTTPTREELVDAALNRLGLPDTHPLIGSGALSGDGAYVPGANHFGASPLTAEEIYEVADDRDDDQGSVIDGGEGTEDEWLRQRFEEWVVETGYPTEQDKGHKAFREEASAELLDEETLASGQMDLALFRRMAVGNYGGPGSQSHVMRYLRDNPDTAEGKLASTIHHLLYGPGDEAQRLDEVLQDGPWKIPGFGESLATKCLAVRYPERWIPLFIYRSPVGAGKRDMMRTARVSPINEEDKSTGHLAVESNDRLRDRVGALLPEDPWGQMLFLWWLRDWAPPDVLAEELLLPQEWLDEVKELTEDKPQLIFYGPPGTGKTFVARRLAESWAGTGNVRLVQFHPSYAYEDFVQGYRPNKKEGEPPSFVLKPGPLMELAKTATESGETCVLIIDEINRGNIAKIFGELYFLLEYRDDKVQLQYGDEFSLPENLLVIGTMNTADRSIALLDAALRRRFHFVPFFPDRPPIDGLLRRWLQANKPSMEWLADVVDRVNEMLDDRHLQIGPSHFMRDSLDEVWLERIWKFSILPYIEEHFFDDPDRVEDFELVKIRQDLQGGVTGEQADDGTQADPTQ